MKPAVRLAALMGLPVKYIWTHDAFRVGEDGPTHQPVEQEAQIRLLEQLKNHHGQNSMLALRPADVHETSVAWKMAMENTKTPTALILSRQNVPTFPHCQAQTGLQMQPAYPKAPILSKIRPSRISYLWQMARKYRPLMDGAQKLESEKD